MYWDWIINQRRMEINMQMKMKMKIYRLLWDILSIICPKNIWRTKLIFRFQYNIWIRSKYNKLHNWMFLE
jgi:hypothetical protein